MTYNVTANIIDDGSGRVLLKLMQMQPASMAVLFDFFDVLTPVNRCLIQILQFAPVVGSIDDICQYCRSTMRLQLSGE